MNRQRRHWIVLTALALLVVLAGITVDSSCVGAQNPSCASACRAQYQQCRISTKGSSACDAQLQACLQGCVSSKR